METARYASGPVLRGHGCSFARQQELIAGHRDEARAVLDPLLRVRFGKGQNARCLARLLDPRDGIGDSGLHLGMGGVGEMAEVGGDS